jgi:hypothetical protein
VRDSLFVTRARAVNESLNKSAENVTVLDEGILCAASREKKYTHCKWLLATHTHTRQQIADDYY